MQMMAGSTHPQHNCQTPILGDATLNNSASILEGGGVQEGRKQAILEGGEGEEGRKQAILEEEGG